QCGPSKANSREHARTCFAILVGLAVASVLLSAGTAAAQYPSYGETMTIESGSVEGAVQDAIDEAADLVYEDLYAELSSTVAPEVGCTLILEPGHPVGAGCSCSASGPNAFCSRNFNQNTGKLTNITCSDGARTTTCQYTANKRTCGCSTK
ncbi:MAG: hypothetical protein VCE43_02445, partial [Myxococcota bacterium]